MNLQKDIEAIFPEQRPANRMSYKIIRTKILDKIGKSEPIVVHINNSHISILTFLLIMTAFAIGISVGHTLDELRLILDTFSRTGEFFSNPR